MKIIRDSIIYLVGDLVSRSVPFILLPYLTRALGVDGFGHLSYYQVIIAMGLIVIGFSLDGALTRYFYRYGKNGIGSLIIAGSIQSSIVFAAIAAFVLYFGEYLIFYSVLAAFSQSILAIFFAVQQCNRKPLWYIAIQLTNAIISTVLTVMLFELLRPEVLYRIIAMVFANIVSLTVAIFLVYFLQKNKVKFSYKYLQSLVKYNFIFGLPLLLHQISFFAKGQADRLLIYRMFNASILGVYSVGYQLASILAILLMAINKATVPYYYESIRNGVLQKKQVLKFARWSILITPIPALFAFFVPNKFYLFYLGAGFDDAKYFVTIFSLAISLTIPYLLLVNYLFYFGKNKEISICTVTASALYILLVYYFAMLNIHYVPYAMIVSNFIMIVMLYIRVSKERE